MNEQPDIPQNTLVIVIKPVEFGWGVIIKQFAANYWIEGADSQVAVVQRDSFIPVIALAKRHKNIQAAVTANWQEVLGKLACFAFSENHQKHLCADVTENTIVVLRPKDRNTMGPFVWGVVLVKSADGMCDVQLGIIKKIKVHQSELVPVMATTGRYKNPKRAIKAYFFDILLELFLLIIGQKTIAYQTALYRALLSARKTRTK